MNPRYFDIHAHLDFPDYDLDRDEIIDRAMVEGVLVNTVGTNPQGNHRAVALAKKHDHIYATVGFHPNDLEKVTASDWSELEISVSTEKKVRGVGECGLDYFRLPADNQKIKIAQAEAFLRQVEIAGRSKKAVMIHTRPTKGGFDAYEDMLELVGQRVRPQYPDLKINLHCFSGDWSLAKKFLDLDCTLSFTGVVTFARDYDETIKKAPVDKIMAETDAPFLSPIPFRGQRNEPIRVALVVETLAQIRGEEGSVLREKLLDNSYRYFDL